MTPLPVAARTWQRIVPLVVALAGTTLAVIVTHQLWRAHLGVPFVFGGDGLGYSMHVRQVVDNGWTFTDPRLGAPFGQHFIDYPMPEVLQLLTFKVLGLFTSNWAAVLNGSYLLGYPLVTATAYWVLRKLQISPWVACACSIVYAMLPYHVYRNLGHLFLSGYYGVPLGVYLAYSIIQGKPLFERSTRRTGALGYISATTVSTVALAAIIALSSVYYAVFTMVLVGSAAFGRIIVDRRWVKPVGKTIAIAAVMGALFVISTLPAKQYHAKHGDNAALVNRPVADTDRYALVPARLFLPIAGHRLTAAGEFHQDYDTELPTFAEPSALPVGAFASAGLLTLLAAGLIIVASSTRGADTDPRLRHGFLFFLVALAFSITGGIATLVSLLVTSEIRAWNRISIVIGFLGVLAIGILLDRARVRFGARRLLWPVALIALTVLAVLDQTPRGSVFNYASVEKEYFADRAFVSQIEERLASGAAVYQLPYVPFPESLPVYDMADYEQLRPYLVSDELRWSYAGVRGRPESVWQERLQPLSNRELVPALVATGFSGILLHRDAYKDGGAEIEEELREVTGSPLASPNGDLMFFDLTKVAKESSRASALASERAELLEEGLLVGGDGLYAFESDSTGTWRWAKKDATLRVEASPVNRPVTVKFKLRTSVNEKARFVISWPDGVDQVLRTDGAPREVSHTFIPTDHEYEIRIESNAVRIDEDIDPRDLRWQVRNFDAEPAS